MTIVTAEEPEKEKLCKHSLPISQCQYCNGEYDKLSKEEKLRKEERSNSKLDWEAIKNSSEHFGEPWSIEDSKVLYKKLNGFSNEKSYKFKVALREVCKLLGRTRRSIKYHYYYMFLDTNDKKRNEWIHREEIEKGRTV